MAQQTQIRQIKISVDTKGDQAIKDIAERLGGLNKNVKSLTGSVGFLKNAFISYLSSLGVRELASMSDSMQLLDARIRILTGNSGEADKVMASLLERANKTKTSVDGLADVYARLSAATKDTKISTTTLLDLTEVLQNSFRLAGSSIQEANSAAIQLSQGFASGQLRGQELRSVLEANVIVGDVLAKTFNLTRGQLYKFAETGQLTAAKVMIALLQNMGDINGKAAQLGQTFEQALTVRINNFKAALLAVNKEFDVSGKFAAGLDLLAEKAGFIGVVVAGLALSQIPLLISALGKLAVAGKAFAVSNPYLFAFTAIATVLSAVFKDLKEFTDYIKFTALELKKFFISIDSFILSKVSKKLTTDPESLKRINQTIENNKKKQEDATNGQNNLFGPDAEALKRLEDEAKANKQRAEDMKRLAALAQQSPEEKYAVILGRLNKQFSAGKIDVAEYYEQLDNVNKIKIDRDFRDGKKELDQYNEEIEKLKRKHLDREFAAGEIGILDFNKAVRETEMASLENKFKMGKITVQEYDAALIKVSERLNKSSAFRSGVQSYLESIGTISSNVSELIAKTFSQLEDKLVEFTKNGKASFADMTQAILDDLLRIILRASVIRPLANGLLGAVNFGGTSSGTATAGGSYTDVSGVAAKGMAFDGGIRRFAKGGLVSGPTLFNYNNGKTGMMGEAGTEAILPLARNGSGDLGVQASVTPVTVNIINNAGVDIEQKESTGPSGERTIEFLIKNRVRQGLANGDFDKVLGASFGLNRKGL